MKNISGRIVPGNRDEIHGWTYKMFAIWRCRRVWLRMIDLWESECERKGAVKLQSGESITAKILLDGPLTGKQLSRARYLAGMGDDDTE